MPTMPWMMAPPLAAPTLRGAQTFSLPGGDRGVAKTMQLIRSLVDQAIKDPYINRTAIEILHWSAAPQYDRRAEAQAIYQWVLNNIRYVQDPVGKETVRPANVILEVGAGDCDDINGVLIPSLLGTIGIPARGVTVAAVSGSNEFSHIYAEALVSGQWIPMDAARPHVTFGQAPEMFSRKTVWPLTGTEIDQVGKLAGMAYMGDAEDWLSAIGTTTSQIISSLRASPSNLYPTSGTTSIGQGILSPSGTYAAVNPGGAVLGTNISGTEIILGVAAIAMLMFAMRR